jgi:hypothetical protein
MAESESTMRRLSALLLLATVLPGCRNACQDLCTELADYAQTACGYTWTDTQISQCIDDQASLTSDEIAACRDNSNVASIWGCDEIADYFNTGGHTADDSGQ